MAHERAARSVAAADERAAPDRSALRAALAGGLAAAAGRRRRRSSWPPGPWARARTRRLAARRARRQAPRGQRRRPGGGRLPARQRQCRLRPGRRRAARPRAPASSSIARGRSSPTRTSSGRQERGGALRRPRQSAFRAPSPAPTPPRTSRWSTSTRRRRNVCAAPAGRLGQREGGRAGRGHRQPVRARPHRHRRHHLQLPAARSRRPTASRSTGHPDGRADQPRQLGRAAARRRGPGDRGQLADRHAGAGGNVGVGFAVPSNTVREVVPEARAGTARSSAPTSASSLAENPAGPARCGLGPAGLAGRRRRASSERRRHRRDRRQGGRTSPTTSRPRSWLDKPGETVEVDVLRDGRRVNIEVKLGTRPARAATP